MIVYTGWGAGAVLGFYFMGLYLLLQSPLLDGLPRATQVLYLTIAHFALSCINYFGARYLNRHEVKHTVYGVRLERIVLIVSLVVGAFWGVLTYLECTH